MKLFGTMRINEDGNLSIGNIDVMTLAKEYGTPLYVVDEALVREQCQLFKTGFQSENMETEVIYASKAFLTIGMCKLINEEGLGLDVVSGGELFTALKAGFPAKKIYMHGNNKTPEEIKMALEAGVGRIVLDNQNELELLERLCRELNLPMDVLIRVNPGIEAHTHEYIQTTKNESKFGVSIFGDGIMGILNQLKDSQYITFKGFHSHIGSQIFQEKSFIEQADVMLKFIKVIQGACRIKTVELNLGGGFGVYYSKGDEPFELKPYFGRVLSYVKQRANELEISPLKVMIEPGRSIVSNAGTTLYTVGSTKLTHGGKHYVFVDGGMTDNPRPSLYSAVYEAVIANRMNETILGTYAVAGKCCESGDVIVKEAVLPHSKPGDILAVASTGAYNYSMSSNYNRLPKPAVVFVKDGVGRCVVRRETFEDLIRNDVVD